MRVLNGGPGVHINEAVLFPFDESSVPLRYRLRIGLVPALNPYKAHERVLEQGNIKDPDGLGMHYYGSVVRVGDTLRMWYGGYGKDNGEDGLRMCYAESKDGIHWDKPNLGLVEFNGSTQNNLVRFDSEYNSKMVSILIIYEPEDPDQNRRFKLVGGVNPFTTIAAFSPDGLNWTESPHNPILKHNTVGCGGLMKFGDCYFLNGQGGNVGTKRALATYISYDFDNWSDAVSVGLRRDRPPYQEIDGPHAGEQVHNGASLWNRGNVVLGIYGMWHGGSTDRYNISMDLGFVTSNDGFHFVEPVPDLKIIECYEIVPERGEGGSYGPIEAPKAEQGQGFENVGDETLIWYWGWGAGYICVARWPRDRIGYAEAVPDPKPKLLFPEDTHDMFWGNHIQIPTEKTNPHFISCPIALDKEGARIFINADGLSQDSVVTVEILDDKLRVIPGYSADACVPITEGGLRQPVSWQGNNVLGQYNHPIRVKVLLNGDRLDDANLYTAYVVEED